MLSVSVLLVGLSGVAVCQSDLQPWSPVRGCLSEKSGKLMLTDKDGDNYLLEGHTPELKAHLGEELSVAGDIRTTGAESGTAYDIKVTSFKAIVRKSPAGVHALLGDPKRWLTFRDKGFGVVIRTPKEFLQQEPGPGWGLSNFVDRAGIVKLQDWRIPAKVFPGSNFKGGTAELSLDPSIRSEGTCRQFGSTTPEYTFSKMLGGRKYAQTQIEGVGMGTADIEYHAHTFQNGFCYEFTFEFDEADRTGITEPCEIQWLTEANQEELEDSLLSQVSFVAPERINSARVFAVQQPVVWSLKESQLREETATQIKLAWSTKGTDYVQLRYRCVKNLFVSGEAGSEMKCGIPTNRNFPANGSETVLLNNFNSDSVRFVVTVDPFLDGVEYQRGSRTLTVEIAPTQHPRSDAIRPSAN